MRFNLPKIIRENKKLFTIFGAIFAFLITVILFILIIPFILDIVSPLRIGITNNNNNNQEVIKTQEGPLHGVNGTISEVDINGNSATIIIESDLGNDINVKITSDTQVFTVERKIVKSKLKTTTSPAALDQLIVGRRIYIRSSKDFFTTDKHSAEDIKSVDIYVN